MRNLIIGLLIGIALTYSVSTIAKTDDPKISGPSGIIKGVEVLGMNGKALCHDPWYYEASKTISCV